MSRVELDRCRAALDEGRRDGGRPTRCRPAGWAGWRCAACGTSTPTARRALLMSVTRAEVAWAVRIAPVRTMKPPAEHDAEDDHRDDQLDQREAGVVALIGRAAQTRASTVVTGPSRWLRLRWSGSSGSETGRRPPAARSRSSCRTGWTPEGVRPTLVVPRTIEDCPLGQVAAAVDRDRGAGDGCVDGSFADVDVDRRELGVHVAEATGSHHRRGATPAATGARVGIRTAAGPGRVAVGRGPQVGDGRVGEAATGGDDHRVGRAGQRAVAVGHVRRQVRRRRVGRVEDRLDDPDRRRLVIAERQDVELPVRRRPAPWSGRRRRCCRRSRCSPA